MCSSTRLIFLMTPWSTGWTAADNLHCWLPLPTHPWLSNRTWGEPTVFFPLRWRQASSSPSQLLLPSFHAVYPIFSGSHSSHANPLSGRTNQQRHSTNFCLPSSSSSSYIFLRHIFWCFLWSLFGPCSYPPAFLPIMPQWNNCSAKLQRSFTDIRMQSNECQWHFKNQTNPAFTRFLIFIFMK